MPDPQILPNDNLVLGLHLERDQRMNGMRFCLGGRVRTRRTQEFDGLIAVFRRRQWRLAHLVAGGLAQRFFDKVGEISSVRRARSSSSS